MTGGRDRKAGWDRRGAGGTNGRLTRPTLNYWPSRSAMSTRTLSKGMCFRASTLPTAQVVSRPPEDAIPTRTQIRCSNVAPEMAIRNFPSESTMPLPPTATLRWQSALAPSTWTAYPVAGRPLTSAMPNTVAETGAGSLMVPLLQAEAETTRAITPKRKRKIRRPAAGVKNMKGALAPHHRERACRTTRPARTPVGLPSCTDTVPFTMTVSMPTGYWCGSVKVDWSFTVAASNTTTSA